MPQPPSPKEMLADLNARSQAAGLTPVVNVPDAPPPPAPPPAPAPTPSPVETPKPVEKPVETPPAPDSFLDTVLGDAKPVAEPAPGKNDKEFNFAELRKQLKAQQEEAKRIADEKAEREAELEQLRGELAKHSLTYDPQFEEKYVKPEAQLLVHVKQVAQTFGADPAEVDRLLNLPGAEFQSALEAAKLGSVVKQQLMNSYMDLFKIRNEKQVALANAHQTQAKFAESRRQEHQQQLQQMNQARNQTFAQAIRDTVARDTTGFFAPKDGFSTADDARATVLAVKQALDAAPGTPPTQHFENQVKLMYKGAAFDRAVAKLNETQQRLDAVLAEAKRLNIPITISQGQVQVPASAKPVETGVMDPKQLLEAAAKGRFSKGGDLHKFGNH